MASAMDKMQDWMMAHVAPIAGRLGQNRFLQAISNGMMGTMPLTIGVAVVAIVINLPIPGFAEMLASSGLAACANELINSTMSLLGIYISFLIAYRYAQSDGMSGVTAGIMSMASFLILIPSTIVVSDEVSMNGYLSNYLGSDGIAIAIVLACFVAWFYGFLMRKNITVKLPDSVPPMVSDSLSPSFAAMIIFCIIFLIKWGFTLTSFGNIFAFVSQIIAAPLMTFGATPAACIAVFSICNLVWFFGIHPNSVLSVYAPVVQMAVMKNIECFMAGQPMPYLQFGLVMAGCYFGGTGNTIGLCIDMFTAKSEKFKGVRNLMIVPNFFNINEPVIFGVPVMLNPVFFVPMVLSSAIPGAIAWIYTSIFPYITNPTISLPWVMPNPIGNFITGGVPHLILSLLCIASSCLLYLPFFKVADAQALEEERAATA